MKHLLLSACITGFAFAGSASAQGSPFCGKAGASDWAEVVETFVGDWRIEHQSGYARMGTDAAPALLEHGLIIHDAMPQICPDTEVPDLRQHAD